MCINYRVQQQWVYRHAGRKRAELLTDYRLVEGHHTGLAPKHTTRSEFNVAPGRSNILNQGTILTSVLYVQPRARVQE